MIARITVAVVALLVFGTMAPLAVAQTYYPSIPVSFSAPDAGCDDGSCDGLGGDGLGCDGDCAGDACSGQWLTPGHCGTGHHSNCRCPRCHPRHLWASFDALLWWGKGRTMPTVATTSPVGTPQATAGVLPGAGILFGNGVVGTRMGAGARADFGIWLDDWETLGLGARVWGLDGDRLSLQAVSPAGTPILARPFFNVVQGQEDAFLVSYPGIINGNLSVSTDSSVIGTEAYLRTNMLSGCDYDLDLMGGYHFVRLDDELSITSNSVSVDPAGAVAIGTTIDVLDVFDARNEFHGGEVGFIGEFRRGCSDVHRSGKTQRR